MSSFNVLRQSPRRVALASVLPERVHSLGTIGLRCRIHLRIEIESGWEPLSIPFVIDSGASYSLISLEMARLRRLPIPPPESEIDLPLTTADGRTAIRVRPGRIRAWWSANGQGYPFDWPVLFRVDMPPGVPPILGLGGIVRTCSWHFDGSFSPEFPLGSLTLTDIR